MTYKHNAFNLIVADTNEMNHVLLHDIQAGTYTEIEWDLSPVEIRRLQVKFEKDKLTDDDIQEDGVVFESFDDFAAAFNGFERIAEWGGPVKDWTDEQLVIDYMSDSGIYTPEVLEEICRRADMAAEWEAADGETFERVAQVAAAELCPELCMA